MVCPIVVAPIRWMARKQIRCHQNGLLTRPQEQTPTSNKGKPEEL